MPVRSKCIASQELRAETVGFFRPRLAPYGLRKPTPRPFAALANMRWD